MQRGHAAAETALQSSRYNQILSINALGRQQSRHCHAREWPQHAQEEVFQAVGAIAVRSDVLHKETRAVKLVFLQTVKEVTTDGADAARRPTDTQYWFIAFFQGDKGATGRRQLSDGRMEPVLAGFRH